MNNIYAKIIIRSLIIFLIINDLQLVLIFLSTLVK